MNSKVIFRILLLLFIKIVSINFFDTRYRNIQISLRNVVQIFNKSGVLKSIIFEEIESEYQLLISDLFL